MDIQAIPLNTQQKQNGNTGLPDSKPAMPTPHIIQHVLGKVEINLFCN